MGRIELKVKFETLTPLWTGNAWGQCMEIRPSSILGSLRFWFEVICYFAGITIGKLDNKGILQDSLDNYLKKYNEKTKQNKTFKDILFEKIGKSSSLEEALDLALDEIELPLPMRIFGCTGWKGRIKINEITYKKKEICIDTLDFYYFLNNLKRNSRFWIEKCIFNNEDKIISVFEDVTVIVTIHVDKYWFEKYLKEFFEFYKNKIILVGGKNSFGFGFVKLDVINEKIDGNKEDTEFDFVIFKEIKLNDMPKKEIFGFNFKYYLRLREKKIYRKKNFGDLGKSSNFYVSNLIKNNEYKIILFGINNPLNNEYKKDVFSKIFNKYSKWLETLLVTGDKNDEKSN